MASASAPVQESSGSSAFTEEEILNELKELGVKLRAEQIAELKNELDQLLTSSSSAQSKPRPSNVKSQNEPISSLETCQNTLSMLSDVPLESLSGDELLKVVDGACEVMQKECERIDRLLRPAAHPTGADKSPGKQPTMQPVSQVSTSSDAQKNALQDLREELRKHGKENALISDSELQQLYTAYEKSAKSDEPLDRPTIRPTLATFGTNQHTTKSTLPFRHDPVKRHALYEQFWRTKPIPGEMRRDKLRWKVREYMLRRDVPVWKP